MFSHTIAVVHNQRGSRLIQVRVVVLNTNIAFGTNLVIRKVTTTAAGKVLSTKDAIPRITPTSQKYRKLVPWGTYRTPTDLGETSATTTDTSYKTIGTNPKSAVVAHTTLAKLEVGTVPMYPIPRSVAPIVTCRSQSRTAKLTCRGTTSSTFTSGGTTWTFSLRSTLIFAQTLP